MTLEYNGTRGKKTSDDLVIRKVLAWLERMHSWNRNNWRSKIKEQPVNPGLLEKQTVIMVCV